MSRRLTGWLFVAAQAVLLAALVVTPGIGPGWTVPAWLRWIGFGLVAAGLAVVGVAAARLGPSLTPTPVPRAGGRLATAGLYRYVRHPIYSGVLLVVVGLMVRSGTAVTVAIGAFTIVFFNQKAAWEEARLSERYPDYRDYAARTPRFVPYRSKTSSSASPKR
jgi:protein-S-isoprenylcysteine O-methyltransferase Ste14